MSAQAPGDAGTGTDDERRQAGRDEEGDVRSAAGALLLASRALVGLAARSLPDPDEVTLPQWRVLVLLSYGRSRTVGELAELLGTHQSSTTRLCHRLHRKALIERSVGRDRRQTSIRLSAAGRRLVDGVTARRRSEITEVVRRMPESARQPVIAALEAFATAAGEPLDTDPAFAWGGR